MSTYIGSTATITRVKAVDVAGEVLEREVLQDDARVVRALGAASAALVDVLLVNEDREGDVVDLDVRPGHVTAEALSADPGLEACRV